MFAPWSEEVTPCRVGKFEWAKREPGPGHEPEPGSVAVTERGSARLSREALGGTCAATTANANAGTMSGKAEHCGKRRRKC